MSAMAERRKFDSIEDLVEACALDDVNPTDEVVLSYGDYEVSVAILEVEQRVKLGESRDSAESAP